MTKITEISILNFIPRFLRGIKKIQYMAIAIDTVLQIVLSRFSSLERMKKIANGDLTDEEIEHLLWERHVDYFDTTLTSKQKIELIQNSEIAHLKKGTPAILKKHLNIIFGDLEFQEWFDYSEIPNRCRIISDRSITDDVLIKINRTAKEFITTRSTFEGVYVKQKEQIDFSVVIAMHDITIESGITIGIQNESINYFEGIAMHDITIQSEKILN